MKHKIAISILVVLVFFIGGFSTSNIPVRLPSDRNCNTDNDCTFVHDVCLKVCGTPISPVNNYSKPFVDGINEVRCLPTYLVAATPLYSVYSCERTPIAIIPKPSCQNGSCVEKDTPACQSICDFSSYSNEAFNNTASRLQITVDQLLQECGC